MTKSQSIPEKHLLLLIFFIGILIWSVIDPKDYVIWILELTPAIIGLIILVITYKKFKLTTLAYFLLTIAGIIMAIGGHYTYGDMPIFNWFKKALHLERNYYDRFGHFFFGATTAIIAREILIRKSPLKRGKLLLFIILSFCLSFGAIYELIEWVVAIISGTNAKAFLGTQGDTWDAQWDILVALLGGIISLLSLQKLHDDQLKHTR